jgi:uncharacterized protein
MWLIQLTFVLFVVYLGIVAIAYSLQTRLLFPAGLASAGETRPPVTAVRLELMTPDNTLLQGVCIPAEYSSEVMLPWIIGFGGNAWNANTVATYLNMLFPDHEVVAFHYRGYEPSGGLPSADGLLADAVLTFDHVRENLGASQVVAVGFSIGSGVAAHLASERPLAGLILVSPFDSLQKLASEHYPWLQVKWLLRHKMETAKALRSASAPTAIIAAENDQIVPPGRTDGARLAVHDLIMDKTIAGAGHNDLYDRPEFRSALVAALEPIELRMMNDR